MQSERISFRLTENEVRINEMKQWTLDCEVKIKWAVVDSNNRFQLVSNTSVYFFLSWPKRKRKNCQAHSYWASNLPRPATTGLSSLIIFVMLPFLTFFVGKKWSTPKHGSLFWLVTQSLLRWVGMIAWRAKRADKTQAQPYLDFLKVRFRGNPVRRI